MSSWDGIKPIRPQTTRARAPQLSVPRMAKIKLPHITTSFRALGYDFRQNDTKLDLISHGPYAGIEVTF